jgi:hypothetical protein
MILNGKHRELYMPHPFLRTVIEVPVGKFNLTLQAPDVNAEIMIL